MPTHRSNSSLIRYTRHFFFFFPRSDKQVVWLSGCLVRNILLVRSIALLLFGLRFVSRLAHLKLKLVDSQVLLLVLSRDLRFVASFPGSFVFYTLSSLVSPKRLSNMSFLSAKHKEKQIPRGDMQEEDSQDDTRETKWWLKCLECLRRSCFFVPQFGLLSLFLWLNEKRLSRKSWWWSAAAVC